VKEHIIEPNASIETASQRLIRDLVAIPTDDGEQAGVAYVADWCTQRGFEHVVQTSTACR
jgi:L-amino acid N-acyltransferase YncA